MVRKITLLLGLFVFLSSVVRSATCVALVSDDWEKPGTWSCGRLPTCGDSVVIPALRVVTITTQLDYEGCGGPMAINIYGTLTFDNGKKILLACGSLIYVQVGGTIIGGGGGGSSNLIDICSNTAWTAGSGPVVGPATVSSGGVTGGLPVELLYFNATNESGQKVKLSWATATETNNKEFEVQRSKDGITFESYTSLTAKGTGNSLITQYYEYTDAGPFGGTSYYRLKQIDKNGDFELYPATAVTIGKKAWVHIVPNPASHSFTLETGEDYMNATLRITNILGEEVMTATLNAHSQTFDASALQNGTYFITLDNGREISKNKIVIQK